MQIGPKTLPNRFYQVPHCTGFGVEKPLSQAAHRRVKAEGGWGGVCTEYVAVSRDSDESPYVSGRMWDEGDAAALGLMAAEVHAYGALAGVELSHTGVHGENSESRLPALAPSQLMGDFAVASVPKQMTVADIRRVQRDWVRSAELSRDAGFDIVYVYGGHTYLPGQFLSPFYNRRADEYGGSLRNRARFFLETLEQVKAAVGDRCAVACRVMVSRGGAAAGIEIEEGLEFVRMADDLVDLWDVDIGSLAEWSHDSGPSRFFAEGWQLEYTGRVREATAKPIVGVGRITDPYLMERIVRSGVWDLIGAARPSIADPFLPAKIREGRLDEIRECIGCNICISKADDRRHLGCTQNPTAGEEHRRGWHPERVEPLADPDREALVVGAGPAGMECAITLAKRGLRKVTLVDAAPLTGGSLRMISQLPGLGEWGRVTAYRTVQARKLPNLELELGTRLDAAAVRARRRRHHGDRNRFALGRRRTEPGHPRAHSRCRRGAAACAHARAGGGGKAAARWRPGGGVRRRRLLHGLGGGSAAGRRGLRGRAGHPARSGRAVRRRDAGGRAHPRAAARGRRGAAAGGVGHLDRCRRPRCGG